MSRYFVKPIVCDYGVYECGEKEMVCMCNIRTNAEIIADVLNADSDVECAHYYPAYPNAKFICRKVNEVKDDIHTV